MRRLTILFIILVMLLAGCEGTVAPKDEETLVLLCTFYPVYVTALNVTNGVQGVEVLCMAPAQAGCLFEYQLTTADRKAIEGASAVVANGLGAEAFLDGVRRQSPELAVIDLGEGLEFDLLSWDGHSHEGHDDGHAHEGEEFNPHVWVSPAGAAAQATLLSDKLAGLDAANAEAYKTNAQAYASSLQKLLAEMQSALEPYKGNSIITFHEAFPYLARDVGLSIAASLSQEEGEQVSAADVAAIVSAVKSGEAHALFTEPYAQSNAAETVSRETGIELHLLDPLTHHEADGDASAYERLQRDNLESLLTALGE